MQWIMYKVGFDFKKYLSVLNKIFWILWTKIISENNIELADVSGFPGSSYFLKSCVASKHDL
jgi:hypothetical protein